MTDKVFIDQKTVQKHIDDICSQVKEKGVDYKFVVGIQRGGLNLSIPLAECIGVKHRSVKISFYDGEAKRKEPVVDMYDLDVRETPFIICDDLIDSGQSIKYLVDKHKLIQGKDYHIAVIHWNKSNENNIVADYYAEEKPQAWVQYSWEAE